MSASEINDMLGQVYDADTNAAVETVTLSARGQDALSMPATVEELEDDAAQADESGQAIRRRCRVKLRRNALGSINLPATVKRRGLEWAVTGVRELAGQWSLTCEVLLPRERTQPNLRRS